MTAKSDGHAKPIRGVAFPLVGSMGALLPEAVVALLG
jgi:hypothetical protein